MLPESLRSMVKNATNVPTNEAEALTGQPESAGGFKLFFLQGVGWF
jgi:hypothetical protein